MIAWILLGVGVVLIALTALYVAAEFSLVTVDRALVDQAAADGDAAAKGVRTALRNLSTQLSGAQVGITVTTLALGYVMEPSLASLLHPLLTGLGLPSGVATGIAVALALALATVASMVFGELVPKNLAIASPLAVAKAVAPVNRATTALARPLIWVLNGMANGVLRLFGIRPQEELHSARSARELLSMVRRSGVAGSIDTSSARLLSQSLRFSSKMADDVLTPRVDVLAVRADDPLTAVIDIAAESGRSRFPVIGADLDDVLGVVHVKRAVMVPAEERESVPVRAVMAPIPHVPGTLPLDDLLVTLRGRGLQMAVVVDEYGGNSGIVTLEDAIEELVGEITDEHDEPEQGCVRQPDGTLLVEGTLRPDEIADLTGLLVPEPAEYETLAGLLIEHLDRLPEAGDAVTLEAELSASASLGAAPQGTAVEAGEPGGLPRLVRVLATVTGMTGRRVATVHLASLGPIDPDDDSGETEDGVS